MATLYELTGQYQALMDMMYDPNVNDETLSDTISAIDGEIEDKADGYAIIMQDMAAEVEKIKKEEKRLSDRRASIQNRHDWLKKRLYFAMKETGKTKFKTSLFSFGIQKNGGKAPMKIDEPDAVPDKYLIPQPPVIDNDAIRKELENGVSLTFAHLEERGESLRIR